MISSVGYFFGLGIVVVMLLWMLRIYNRLHRIEQVAREQSANILVALVRRYDLLPEIVKLMSNQMAYEKSLIELAELQSIMKNTQKADVIGLQSEIKHAESLLTQVMIAVKESYPAIHSSTQFSKLVTTLVETEDKVAVARSLYNRSAAINVEQFIKIPHRYFARFVGFKPYDFIYFEVHKLK